MIYEYNCVPTLERLINVNLILQLWNKNIRQGFSCTSAVPI